MSVGTVAKRFWYGIGLATLLTCASPVAMASWINSITNYNRVDYKAGSQNWQIAQRNNAWMYFANKMGVLEFNGIDWRLYTLHNRSDVRSLRLSTQSDRIYVAGTNELGYLEPDATGQMQYHTILSDSSIQQSYFGNVWKIHESAGFVYFCADNMVLRLSPQGTISTINSPDKIDASVLLRDALYIGTQSGIYVLTGEHFYHLAHADLLKGKKIKEMLPFKGKILVGTALNGLFVLDEKTVTPFKTNVDEFIKRNELFSLSTENNRIAVGTILKGALLMDYEGTVVNYFNESHGLQNNTILSLNFDISGNLWLGLDNGISYVDLNSPITNLYLPPNFYGAGYAATLYNNNLYLGTNQGLYHTAWPITLSEVAPNLELVEGLRGQVWGITKVDDELVCCLDRGVYSLKEKKVISWEINEGAWTLRQFREEQNKFWLSTYYGFYVIERRDNKWMQPTYVKGFTTSMINFEEVGKGVLLIKNGQREIIRLELNEALDSVVNIVTYKQPEIPFNPKIYHIFDGVKLCSSEGFYRYEKKTFWPDKELNHLLNQDNQQSYCVLRNEEEAVWAMGDNVLSIYRKKSKDVVTYHHDIPIVANFEALFPLDTATVIVPNENGFLLWETAKKQKLGGKDELLQIVSVRSGSSYDSIVYVNNAGGSKEAKIAYKDNSIRFYFNKLDYSGNEHIMYRCKMDKEPWSEYTNSQAKSYTRLSVGTHTFTVTAQVNNDLLLNDEFTVTILPPWYRTIVAYIAYILLLIALCYGVWYWDDLRIKRKKMQLISRQQKELKAKEAAYKEETERKEQEITSLKSEQLEMEVRHKDQELANAAISLARKNEALTEIRNDLQKLSNAIREKEADGTSILRNVLRISNKIEGDIVEDDNLKRFEEHFNLVHNNFMQHLSEQFPSLTLNERKMCAFIKMQLSSKEMAPLLNISLRGVETLRYRLRKKLGLTHDENLSTFLTNFGR